MRPRALAFVLLWPLCASAAEPLNYELLDKVARSVTEAQWDELADSLVGIPVTWTGQVVEVEKNWLDDLYEVRIDMDRTGVSDVYFDVRREIALSLKKDGWYRFRGTIRNVSRIFGSPVVTLDAVLFVRE